MKCEPTCVKPRQGTKQEHCGICHETFSSPSLGSAHRVAADVEFINGKARRIGYRNRCMSHVEMIAEGWRKVGGMWRGPKTDYFDTLEDDE